MTYTEDDYLIISGIQHFVFCRRQWALIHVEQQWAENEHTVIGKIMHEKAHDPYLREKRKDVLISRALPVVSRKLGLTGECDVVEFHKCEDGIRLFGHRDEYQVFPIEYKKGSKKYGLEDILQLTAQVLCLEEMFSASIPFAALYYGETRHREKIEITEELRNKVEEITEEMHEYMKKSYTPMVRKNKACRACSLKEICMPELEKTISVKGYMKKMLSEEKDG